MSRVTQLSVASDRMLGYTPEEAYLLGVCTLILSTEIKQFALSNRLTAVES